MQVMAFGFVILWLLAFPFVYGLALSGLFGLTKKIDQWILIVMHISISTLALITAIIVEVNLKIPYISVPYSIVLMVLVEGFIWQFFLKDRKINGFLASLICNAVFFVPLAIGVMLSGLVP